VKKETREDMTSPKTKDKGVYCYACKLECHDNVLKTPQKLIRWICSLEWKLTGK
jgi:hypothetical protein